MNSPRMSAGVGAAALTLSTWATLTADAPRVAPEVASDVTPEGVRHHRRHRDADDRDDRDARHHRHHRAPDAAPSAPAPNVPVAPAGQCPEGTVRVTGDFCPEVRQECLEMSDDERERCLHFRKPTRCRSRRTRPMDFCIDRYEWPNREGAAPAVVVSWNEAADLCRRAGRRLCTEDEWTLACEGPAMLPYPWGYDRDATTCNIDRHNLEYERDVVTGNDRERAAEEAARVSQAAPSGAYPRCESPYGARDMTGNVDEWAVSRTGAPHQSVLKGGYWGRVRTRCRPATRRHDEGFRYYQIGFRCCADL